MFCCVSRESKLLGGEGVGNAAGGGKVKVLYTRTKHNAKVDPTMDVINAFECAMREGSGSNPLCSTSLNGRSVHHELTVRLLFAT